MKHTVTKLSEAPMYSPSIGSSMGCLYATFWEVERKKLQASKQTSSSKDQMCFPPSRFFSSLSLSLCLPHFPFSFKHWVYTKAEPRKQWKTNCLEYSYLIIFGKHHHVEVPVRFGTHSKSWKSTAQAQHELWEWLVSPRQDAKAGWEKLVET